VPLNAKQKGANGEREAATLLDGWAAEIGFDVNCTRNLEQTRGGGYDLNGIPGLAIEVKRVEQLNVKAWWAQACRQAEEKVEIPFLMYRQNRKPWTFKVLTYVSFFGDNHGGATRGMEVSMDAENAKIWLQTYLQVCQPQLTIKGGVQ